MNREQKAAAVEEIAGQITESNAVYAIDYRGISVPQAAELRARLRDTDATFRVVKNTLTLRAADKADAQSLKALLEGPTALAFVRGDVAAAAKALNDYARQVDGLPFKGGLMDGEALDAAQVQSIARLPTRDALYGQLVGVVAAPVSGLVRTLNALLSGLAIQLGAIAEQGLIGRAGEAGRAGPVAESSEEPPAPEEPDQDPGRAPDQVQPDQPEGEDDETTEEDE